MEKKSTSHLPPVRKFGHPTNLFYRWLEQKRVGCSSQGGDRGVKFGQLVIPPTTSRSWSWYRSLRNSWTVHAQTGDTSDGPYTRSNVVTDEMIEEFLAKDTGIDRLKRLYFKGPLGDVSEELEFVYTAAFNAGVLAFLVRGYLGGKEARLKFIADNKATTFGSRFQANRKINEAVWMGMMKTGVKTGLTIGSMVGVFLLISQSVAVYRRKSSVLEYTVAGGICGGLYRLPHGPKSMVLGIGVASAFGLVAGTFFLILLKISGHTQEERSERNLNYVIIQDRLEKKYQT